MIRHRVEHFFRWFSSCYWLILLLGNYLQLKSVSQKWIGGRYPAFRNPGGSCRSIDWSVTSGGLIPHRPRRSCLVLSCTSPQMGPWHSRGQTTETVWRHRRTTAAQKKLLPHLVLQRRCILVREPRGVKSVTVSGVRTTSGAEFSEHPLIRTHVHTCSVTLSRHCDEFTASELCSHWSRCVFVFYENRRLQRSLIFTKSRQEAEQCQNTPSAGSIEVYLLSGGLLHNLFDSGESCSTSLDGGGQTHRCVSDSLVWTDVWQTRPKHQFCT